MAKRNPSGLFMLLSLALAVFLAGCSDVREKELTEESLSEQPTQEPVKEPPQEPIKEPTPEPVKESIEQPVKEPPQEQVMQEVITANFLQPAQETPDWLGQEYFVRNWLVLGPYPYDAEKFGGEWGGQDATDVAFVEDEHALTPEEGALVGDKTWQKCPGSDRIDLDEFYDNIDFAVAYLGAYVYSPTPLNNAILYIGSDDYVKVYINEELVHTYKDERRAADVDSDKVPGINLKPGWNKIIVKVVDVVGAWEIYLRFADANDNPMQVLSEKAP